MRMTPLEIQSHRFARRVRGFDRDEVESFLQMVTEDYEALVIENAEQRGRARRLEEKFEASQGQETLLRETLITAQSMSDRLRSLAEKECRTTRNQAEQHAAEIVRKAERDVVRLKENIRELQGLRTRTAESLRSMLRSHLKWVDELESESATDSQEARNASLTPEDPAPCPKSHPEVALDSSATPPAGHAPDARR